MHIRLALNRNHERGPLDIYELDDDGRLALAETLENRSAGYYLHFADGVPAVPPTESQRRAIAETWGWCPVKPLTIDDIVAGKSRYEGAPLPACPGRPVLQWAFGDMTSKQVMARYLEGRVVHLA